MQPRKTVVVIDDHPLVRRGVIDSFHEEHDFEVVGKGATAEEAVALASSLAPDIILLDINLPGGGLNAATQIVEQAPRTAIIMLSIREDLAAVRAALKAGARAYLTKGISSEDLVDVARRVLAGQKYVSPDLAARLLENSPDDVGQLSEQAALSSSLSAREKEILKLLGAGRTNQQIARQLGLSENTIKHYVSPILRKLGANNRTEAALMMKVRST